MHFKSEYEGDPGLRYLRRIDGGPFHMTAGACAVF
jgi:hypothetical protein